MTGLSPKPGLLLLGEFVAESASGHVLRLPKKAQALLAFLHLQRGRQVARDEIVALFWSGSGSAQARQSLRQCMSTIRNAIPSHPRIFVSRGDLLGLASDAFDSDIDALSRIPSSASLRELARAEKLFRGEFVAGLAVRQPFDDWADDERRRFAGARGHILTQLAKRRAEAGDYVSAVETARQLTRSDPLGEHCSRLLMELLAASGQRGLALLEFDRLKRALRQELQIAPDAGIQSLADNIRRSPAELACIVAAEAIAPDADAVAVHHRMPRLMRRHDRPSLSILPLDNLSGDPSDDGFLKCLADEVVCALLRERWPIVVLARHDSQIEPATQAISARYVSAGSFRRDASSVRMILRLTDASQDRVIWSDRLAMETCWPDDRLCAYVVSRLTAAISAAEVRRVSCRPVETLTAYELYLRASELCRRGVEGNSTALHLLRRAIAREPDFAPAYALAARCLHLRRLMGWVFPQDPQLRDATRLAHRAVDIDDRDPQSLWMSGLAIANVDGNLRDGLHLVTRSLAINPTDASAWIGSSFIQANLGEGELAIQHFKRAQHVNPDDASQHLQWHAAATAYFVAGQYDDADQAADTALLERPTYPGTLRLKIATAGLLGRTASAHEAARRLATVNPDVTMSYVRKYWQLWPSAKPAVAAMIDGWRRAGMPEGVM